MQDYPAPDEQMLLSMLGETCYILLDTIKIAEEAGNVLTQNVVLLGAASLKIPLSPASLKQAIRETVPKKTVDLNLKAFEFGVETGKNP
jgi:indolepyruvate ferredoxin oxidoreductase beta subunit